MLVAQRLETQSASESHGSPASTLADEPLDDELELLDPEELPELEPPPEEEDWQALPPWDDSASALHSYEVPPMQALLPQATSPLAPLSSMEQLQEPTSSSSSSPLDDPESDEHAPSTENTPADNATSASRGNRMRQTYRCRLGGST